MDALSGMEQEEPAFDALRAIREAEGCYTALTDAIAPYAEEKKANYKIKDIGYSRWSRVARLSVEQSAELAPLIAQVLGCGMDEAFREQLNTMTYGKGFVVALYQDAQGGTEYGRVHEGQRDLRGRQRPRAFLSVAFTGDEQRRIPINLSSPRKNPPRKAGLSAPAIRARIRRAFFSSRAARPRR